MQPTITMKLIDVSEGLPFFFCFFPRLLPVYTPKYYPFSSYRIFFFVYFHYCKNLHVLKNNEKKKSPNLFYF